MDAEPPRERDDPVLTTSDTKEQKAESKEQARRNKIKWPKADESRGMVHIGRTPNQDPRGSTV